MTAHEARPEFGERAEFGPGDVCYLHPRTHSFTLCHRCGNTICSDCQISSPVGVLCPDCTKHSHPTQTHRPLYQRFASSHTPVSYTILILSVLVFLAQIVGKYFAGNIVTGALWYAPLFSLPDSSFYGLSSNLGFEPWRMITVIFTHSTEMILHILFNMYALWLFGRNLEHLIGSTRFLLLYLYAGVGGSLGVMLWAYIDPHSMLTPTVGASGAIFGVLGATLLAFKAAGVNITSLAVLIAINLGIGFIPGTSISWQAHLGGIIIGAITMWIILASRGPRHRNRAILTLCALGVALAALSCLYFVTTPNFALIGTL